MPTLPLTPIEQKAWSFAQEAHQGVYRKFLRTPYFEGHVAKVFGILKQYDTRPTLGAAAILHDTLEDVDYVTFDLIKDKFGIRIAKLVKELTSDEELVSKQGKANYLLNKMIYMSDDALLIKLCDRLQNISDMYAASVDFRSKYLRETLFITEGLKSKRRLNQKQSRIINDIEALLNNIKKRTKLESKSNLKYISLFEDFKVNNITEDDIINCIKQGGTIDVEIVQNKKGKPTESVRPVSIDNNLISVEIDNEIYEVELDDVKRINIESFNESLDFMGDENIKSHFPKELELYTTYGTHDYVLSDITRENSIIRVTYFVNTPEETGDNVLADGDPDLMTFDIHVINNSNGVKLNVDMTHGDRVVYEFTIEAPNKVNVHFYDGIGSKADEDTHFGLSDESLDAMIKVFSKFNDKFNLNRKDFTFMDKYPDSYQVIENAKIAPLSQDEVILVVNNTEPQKNRYLNNLLKYLRTRGIEHIVASDVTEIRKAYDTKKIVGAILTGSEYRINETDDKLCRVALKNLKCPILGICFGFQSMCKNAGVEIVEGDKMVLDHEKLTEYKDSKLFKDVDLKSMKLSFSFHDYPSDCPSGYSVIGKLNDIIVAIANEKNERYGVLFHPEDVEFSQQILDNFIGLCHSGQDEQEKLLKGQFEGLKRFDNFR